MKSYRLFGLYRYRRTTLSYVSAIQNPTDSRSLDVHRKAMMDQNEKVARAAFINDHNLREILTLVGTGSWVTLPADKLAKFVDTLQRLDKTVGNAKQAFDKTLKSSHDAGKLADIPRFRTRTVASETVVDIDAMFGG